MTIKQVNEAALRRVQAVLEEGYVKWFPNGRPRQVVAVVSVDNSIYAKLKGDKWTSTQLCFGSKVDHFALKSPGLACVYSFGRKHRGNARKAVRGLVALGLVTKEDGEIARLRFIDQESAKEEHEMREELKRRARNLGFKLVEARR